VTLATGLADMEALATGELIVRHQLMLISDRVSEAARLDPDDGAARHRGSHALELVLERSACSARADNALVWPRSATSRSLIASSRSVRDVARFPFTLGRVPASL
jgi:hypothetical protein